MRYLRENKTLVFVVLMLLLFLGYLDRELVRWVKAFPYNDTIIERAYYSIDHALDAICKGAVPVVIALVVCLFGKFFSPRAYEAGRSLLIGLASTGIIVQILKHVIGRARPKISDATVFVGVTFKGGYDSFPSGHVAAAFCFAYILTYYFPRCGAVFYVFAVTVGAGRFLSGAHFPSDVMAGAVVGIAVGRVLLTLTRRLPVPNSLRLLMTSRRRQ